MRIWLVTLAVLIPLPLPAEPPDYARDVPSREMLEFLEQWGGTDDATFEAMIHFGVRDTEQQSSGQRPHEEANDD